MVGFQAAMRDKQVKDDELCWGSGESLHGGRDM